MRILKIAKSRLKHNTTNISNNKHKQHSFNPIATPPKYLWLLLTSECNLRCKHCHMWMNEDTSNGISLSEQLDVVRQFHQLNPKGLVGMSGGEILLKGERFLEISRLCRELNQPCVAITNASLIDEGMYDKILMDGPDSLVISLDSHIEEIHDYMRGTKGAFQHTVKTLKGLVDLRREKYPNSNRKIIVNSVLFEKNIALCHEYMNFVRGLGVDGASLQCLYSTYQNKSQTNSDSFFEKNFFKDKDVAIKMLDEVVKTYKKDGFLITDTQDYEYMKRYIKEVDFETRERICGAHEKNILIDHKGDYSFCGNMHEISGIEPLGNIREISLKNFWISSTTERVRGVMNQCRKHCGMYACHKREDI